MCCVLSCFGWALDFIQRVITFLLACIMSCAICIGLIMAVTAGVAYGYNYSLAEFLSLARTDISVYVRRGQFYDKPDLSGNKRRSGDENDLFSSNLSDYQDTSILSDSKPLSNTWLKALDTGRYGEKLSKYSNEPVNPSDGNYNFRPDDVTHETETVMEDEVTVTVVALTRSRYSEPVSPTRSSEEPSRTTAMTDYETEPSQRTQPPEKKTFEDDYIEADRPTNEIKSKDKRRNKSDTKFRQTKTPFTEYSADELDENNVYKPV